MMRRSAFLHTMALISLLLASSATTQAQTTSTPQTIVVEKIPSDFVIAPDFKATELDDRFAQLAGVYAGRITDDTLLVGGAAYWLVNGSDDFKLAYGGLLLGWNADRTGRIRFGARGLVGVGSATLGRTLDGFGIREPIRFGGRNQVGGRALPVPAQRRVRVSDDFFVIEPQADVAFHLTDRLAVTGAAGYRAVALTDGLRALLDGPTLSLGLQFGW